MDTNHPLHTSLLFRRAQDRFHTQLDWLDSWHSFSFSSHFDPNWMGFGRLRVINDDTIAPGRGFGMHPHRDMEIITVMVDGQLSHQDSMGHTALLHAGDVQRMSAGTGIVHSEWNEGEEPCRLVQIWIEPSKTSLQPSYEEKAFRSDGGWTPLLHPERRQGAMAIHAPVRLWRAQLVAKQSIGLPFFSEQVGWIQMIAGTCKLTCVNENDSMELARGDGLGLRGALSSPPVTWLVTAGVNGADVLVFAL
ncbi:MAG: hypothetical protein RLZZ609_292 [Cyanobacteriota bacterium]